MGSLELVTSSSRKSFDSAYANLETTVRNFSRDKMQYEDTIKKLKADLNGKDAKLKENALVIESLISENETLLSTHDEDVAANASMDALMCTVTLKQDLFSKTVNDFESLEKEILDRYESAEVFIESVKSSHEKLLGKLKFMEEELLKETIHSKDLQNKLQAVRIQLEGVAQKLEEERHSTQDLQGRLGKVNQKLENCNHELQQEREMSMQLQDLVISVKGDLETKERVFRDTEERLTSIQRSLQQEITDTTGKLMEVSKQFETSTEELKQERELTATLQETLTGVKSELEAKEQVVRDTEERLASVELSLKQEITDTNEKLEEVHRQLECSTQELKQERDLIGQLQESLVGVKGELEAKEQVVRDTEERLTSVEQSLKQEISDTKGQLEEVTKHLECSTQDLKQEKEVTATLQQTLTNLKVELEAKEQAVKDTEERLTSVEQSLKQEIAETKEKLVEVNKQLESSTQELTQERVLTTSLQEMNKEINVKYEEALSSIKNLESLRKAESDQYAVEIHEQIEIVEVLKVEKVDLANQLELLQQEKRTLESTFVEELNKKDETIRNNFDVLAHNETLIASLQEDLIRREAEHKKKMEGLKHYLDSEKSTTPRKSAVQLPAPIKKPAATPLATKVQAAIPANRIVKQENVIPSTNRSILKRSCSGDQGLNRNPSVHFNYNVEVRKFHPTIFNISSSSDSEDSQATEAIRKQKKQPDTSAPPAKKSKSVADEDRCESPSFLDKNKTVAKAKENKATEKETSLENEDSDPTKNIIENKPSLQSAASPKRFFRSKLGQCPGKSTSSCKSPRVPKENASHHVHGLHKGPGPLGHGHGHSHSITKTTKQAK